MVEREILDIGAAVDKIIKERLGRMFTVNLNDTVKVRLTDLGKDIYYHRYDNLNRQAGREICEPKFPDVDKEGCTSFQLWDFISLYGGYIGMARPNVIEPLDIICPIKGHGDPPGEPGPRGVPSKYLPRDGVERTIADVINRGGTMGEILTEVHHLDGADIKWAKDQPGPKGFLHWIDVEDPRTPSGGYTCCSSCGYSIPWDYHSELAFWKFCPKCGMPREV